MKDNFITRTLRRDFPNLNYDNCRKTSEATREYNCIAWALEIRNSWLYPDDGNAYLLKKEGSSEIFNLTTIIKSFQNIGYKVEHGNKAKLFLPHIQKIAIYTLFNNAPSHVARQLCNGKWTSKLGENIDIEHDTLEVLEGPAYGLVRVIMSKVASWPRYAVPE
jgi:hypothetical protein